MKTYFASPQRTSKNILGEEIKAINQSEVIQGLLHTVSGLIAIIDDNRQILAVNDSFLDILGIKDPQSILGLRPGEALNCIHSQDEDGGCGTSKYCATCGAAVAIVTCQGLEKPIERRCCLEADKKGKVVDLPLLVKAHPIEILHKKYILLFVKDITTEQQRAALERTFFHDINNMLFGLVGASEELAQNFSDSNLAKRVHEVSLRMAKEVQIQRNLIKKGTFSYEPTLYKTTDDELLEELKAIFSSHPLANSRKISIVKPLSPANFSTDLSLALRVMSNMVTNALEASEEGGTIKVWSEPMSKGIAFHVYNKASIDESVALRIFQRNFSTKDEDGRGLGTYSMKLFGETILKGTVNFTSSEERGTVFTFSLPAP